MKQLLILMFLAATMLGPAPLLAAPALDPYTPEHFWLLPHTEPAWFESDGVGGFYGETVDGVTFTQTIVANQAGIKLHRFNIGTAAIYISDKGVIEADNDLAAVSMYFTTI